MGTLTFTYTCMIPGHLLAEVSKVDHTRSFQRSQIVGPVRCPQSFRHRQGGFYSLCGRAEDESLSQSCDASAYLILLFL
jgi:hypothetical protein